MLSRSLCHTTQQNRYTTLGPNIEFTKITISFISNRKLFHLFISTHAPVFKKYVIKQTSYNNEKHCFFCSWLQNRHATSALRASVGKWSIKGTRTRVGPEQICSRQTVGLPTGFANVLCNTSDFTPGNSCGFRWQFTYPPPPPPSMMSVGELGSTPPPPKKMPSLHPYVQVPLFTKMKVLRIKSFFLDNYSCTNCTYRPSKFFDH